MRASWRAVCEAFQDGYAEGALPPARPPLKRLQKFLVGELLVDNVFIAADPSFTTAQAIRLMTTVPADELGPMIVLRGGKPKEGA